MLMPMDRDTIFAFNSAYNTDAVERINPACFNQDDGYESRWIVEFFRYAGRIVRTCYDRRTTCTVYAWVVGDPAERIGAIREDNYVI